MPHRPLLVVQCRRLYRFEKHISEIPPKVGHEPVTSRVAGACVSHSATVNRYTNIYWYTLIVIKYPAYSIALCVHGICSPVDQLDEFCKQPLQLLPYLIWPWPTVIWSMSPWQCKLCTCRVSLMSDHAFHTAVHNNNNTTTTLDGSLSELLCGPIPWADVEWTSNGNVGLRA